MEHTPKNILIIDDDADIRAIVGYILTEEGYQIKELANGHHVPESVSARRPDLILLDVMLGDTDGRDICRELKNAPETSDIPIIIVSATHANPQDSKGCQANDYLAKPFDIGELIRKVCYYAAA